MINKDKLINLLMASGMSVIFTTITVLAILHGDPGTANTSAGIFMFFILGCWSINLILAELVDFNIEERRYVASAFIFILKLILVFCVIS